MKITDLNNYSVVAPANEPLLKKQKADGGFDFLDNPLTRGIQSFFPGEKVGEAIGTLGGLGLTKAKETLGLAPQGATSQFDTNAATPLQVAGDVVEGAANVAGFKGVGGTGSLAQRVLKTAGLGSAISGGSSIAAGNDLGQVGKDATAGAAVGAALPLAGAGLKAVGKQFQTLPDRFLNSAFGRTKSQIVKEISSGKGDTFNKYILDNKSIGTADTLLKESKKAVVTLGKTIDDQLGAVKKPVNLSSMLDDVTNTPQASGALIDKAGVSDIVKRLAPQSKQLLQKDTLTLKEANKLRQLLDETLGDRAFLGGQITNDKTILKAFADNLREVVKTKAPTAVRSQFNQLSKEIQLRNALVDRIAQKSKNQVLSIGDVFGGGLGGVLGGGPAGIAAGVAARRGIESVPFKLSAAKFTDALTKAAPVLEQLTPAQQTVISDLFALFQNAENDQ